MMFRPFSPPPLLCGFAGALLCATHSPLAAREENATGEFVEMTVTARAGDPPSWMDLPSPGSVTALSSATLRDRNIDRGHDVASLIPNVSATEGDGARATSFSIRGSHELTFHELTGGRSSMGFYVDDIPFLDAYGRDLSWFAIDGVSVYKGPHGTAFGAPGPMGVFDISTRPVGRETAGDFSYIRGSHDLHRAAFQTGGRILPTLSIGLDGLFSKDEGWFTDTLTGDPYGKHETLAGRLRLVWTPSDPLEITFTAGISRHDDDPAAYVASATTRNRYKLPADPDAFATGGQHYQALRAIWKADTWQVKSITSHRRSDFDDSDNALVLDLFDPFSLQRQREQDIRSWTQEFRVESTDPEAAFRWRTGLFFSHNDSFLDHFILGLGPWEGKDDVHYRRTDFALYGEATRAVGERLELSGGVRLQTTRDHTRSEFIPTPFAESLGAYGFGTDERETFSALLPMAALRWKWSALHQSYFRFSTGSQPGGLAVASNQSRDYDAEKSFNFELGHDSSFLTDSLQLHLAVYHTAYRDYQSFQFLPSGQTIYNADRASAWGAELELKVRPAEGLELYAGGGYTRARFDDFNVDAGDFGGNRINKIPRATVNAGASYRAGWGGCARVDWRYTGKTYFDEANTVKHSGYSVVDARIGYEQPHYGVYLFARNLFDTEYYSHTYLFQGVPAASPGIPRLIGAEVRASF